MPSAVVVGSGPNGLACAATLASRGVEVTVIEAEERIGGGTRSGELTEPGLIHDECSAAHPMVVSSPAVVSLGLELERHGLEWCWAEVDLAHPLDGGDGATMVRSLDETAAGLGRAGATLTVALYVYAKEQGEFGAAFAIAAVLMLLTLVLNLAAGLVGRYFRRKKEL